MRKYMKVQIKKNAKEAYIGYMIHRCRSPYSDSYCKIMERLAGRVVEVDIKYTFDGIENVETKRLQFDIFAEKLLEARDINKALKNAIGDLKKQILGSFWIQYIMFVNQNENWNDQADLYRITVDYMVRYNES